MELTRRRFFQALAASVVAAGVPLPIGVPREPKLYVWHRTSIAYGVSRMTMAQLHAAPSWGYQEHAALVYHDRKRAAALTHTNV